MGLKELERNRQADKTTFQTEQSVQETRESFLPPNTITHTQAHTPEQQDELMAWAITQQESVAIPTETILVGEQVEKRLFKSPKRTPIYAKESFHITRAKALRKKLPQLYADKKNDDLLKMAAAEIDLTLNRRLDQAKAPELILLEKLNQGQLHPDSANIEELRQEMTAFNLTTGEERVPLEGAFTNAELLVLMTANLCNFLRIRTDSAANRPEISAAKQAIDTLAHTSNTYANILVNKVYTRIKPVLEEREREQQRIAAEKRAEAIESARLRDEENCRKNSALLRLFVADHARDIAGLSDPIRLQVVQEELLTKMGDEMTRELLEDEVAKADFMQKMRDKLPLCSMYQRVTRVESDIRTVLDECDVAEDIRPILRTDSRFLDRFLGDATREELQDTITKMTDAINENITSALQRLNRMLPTFSPEQHRDMVNKLKCDMPHLFLEGTPLQISRQLDLLVHYHRLMTPQLAPTLTLTKEASIPPNDPPPVSKMAQDILAFFPNGDALYQFLPDTDSQAFFEQALLQQLTQDSLDKMDTLQRRELIAELTDRLATIAPLAKLAFEREPLQLRQSLLSDLLRGASMEELGAHATALRKELQQTEGALTHAVALRVLSPISADGTKMVSDFRDTQYNTTVFGSRELRAAVRFSRMDNDLRDREITNPELFRAFVVKQVGTTHLNKSEHNIYEGQLNFIAKRIQKNLASATNLIQKMEAKHVGKVEERKRILENLYPLMVYQKASQFSDTLKAVRHSFSSGEMREELREHAKRQSDRIEDIQKKYPQMHTQDIRNMLANNDDLLAICSHSDAQWEDYITPRIEKVLPVLQLIDREFCYIKDLPDQLRLAFGQDIYQGNYGLDKAREAFRSHYESLVDKKIDKNILTAKSIDNSITTLLKDTVKDATKRTVLTSYFLFLLSECTLNEVLELNKVWTARGEAITTRVLANDTLIKDFIKGITKDSLPKEAARLEAGFIQYMRQPICTQDTPTLEQNLTRQWQAFSELDNANQKETKEAHITMAQRVVVMRDVELHRKESVALLQQEEERRAQLFDLQAGQCSVFRSAVKDGREDWDARDVTTATKTLTKLQDNEKKGNPDSVQPSPMVTGILAEYLSCRKDFKEVRSNEDTLKALTQKVTQLEQGIRTACAKAELIDVEDLVGKTVILSLSLYEQGALNGLNLFGTNPIEEGLPALMFHEHTRRNKLIVETTKSLQDATQGELLGLDSLTSKDFDLACKQQESKTKILKSTTDIAKKYIATTGLDDATSDTLLSAWLVYRHKDCMEYGETNSEVLHTMAQSDFANKELVDILLTVSNRDIHKSFLDKGTLGSGGSTTLSAQEQKGSTLSAMTREGFEGWFSTNAKKDQAEAYNALSLEERKLFAFGLSMPAHLLGIGATTAGKLVKSVTPEVGGELACLSLQSFILTGDTSGLDKLDYQRAVAGLNATRTRFGFRTKVFESAIAFATFCIQARRESLPPDRQRLCDAKASIKAAGKEPPTTSCQTTEELRTFLLQESTQLPKSLQTQLTDYSDSKLLLLVNVLQNRTLLDRTCTSKEKDRTFVDQEGRDALMGEYASNLSRAIMAQRSGASAIESALLSLHSYQVQDGLVLGETLHKSELHEAGYQRTTAVDISLLQSGMEMVDQIFKEGLRLQSISQASALIEQSQNKQAIKAYHDFKDCMNDEGDFGGFICAQVQSSLALEMESKESTLLRQPSTLSGDNAEILGLYAAYQSLSDEERRLFFKALGSRDVLDISKQSIMANRFGFRERDYANPVARNRLLDEYASARDVLEEDQSIQRAFASILSTQVDDSADFDKVATQEGGLAAKLTSHRETAVDWKLFKRAIQFVHRANNEQKTYNGQFELYAATGTVHKEGDFHFESDFLRRNIHNAGNRFTRFLGRRAAAQTVGRVADAIGDTVSDHLCQVLGNRVTKAVENALSPTETEGRQELSKARQLELNKDFLSVVQQSRDPDILDKMGIANDALGDVADYAAHAVTATISTVAGSIIDIAEDAVNVYQGVKGLFDLKDGVKEADGAKEQDKAKQEEAKARQTEAQQKRFAEALSKLDGDLDQSSDLTKKRQVDAITEGVGEMISKVLSVEALEGAVIFKITGEVINEALKIVNFARAAFDEKRLVDRNLEADKVWQEKKASLTEDFPELGACEVKTYDFALGHSGFENMTEYASAKGLDFVQSILFSASRFNNLKRSKILARTILMVLKVESVSEDYHTLNANVVFDRLMGGKYR